MEHQFPEICGSMDIAHPTALLLGRRLWKTYFVSLDYESTQHHRPILRVKRKSEHWVYILSGSNVRVERPKLTTLGHSRGKRTLVLEDAMTKTPWLYLSTKNKEQHVLWIRNFRKMLPQHTHEARESRMQLRAAIGTLTQKSDEEHALTTWTKLQQEERKEEAKKEYHELEHQDQDQDVVVMVQQSEEGNKTTKEKSLLGAPRFLTLDIQGIDAMRETLCCRAALYCNITLDDALALFRSFRWNWPALSARWHDDHISVLASIGVFSPVVVVEVAPVEEQKKSTTTITTTTTAAAPAPPAPAPAPFPSAAAPLKASSSNFTCDICYDDFPSNDVDSCTLALACGHRFCLNCWREHAQSSMAAGPLHLWSTGSTCPQHGCDRYIPTKIFVPLLENDTNRHRFQVLLRNNFVDNCPLLHWCGSVMSCQHAIALSPSAILQYKGDRSFEHMVDVEAECNACGHSTCFDCGKKPHGRASCMQAETWQKHYLMLEEAAGTEESKQNDEKWLAQNTRPCPSCKSPIQRNFGCNHMTCNCCGHEFCWVCMELW